VSRVTGAEKIVVQRSLQRRPRFATIDQSTRPAKRLCDGLRMSEAAGASDRHARSDDFSTRRTGSCRSTRLRATIDGGMGG
jgi:hypothetical protein